MTNSRWANGFSDGEQRLGIAYLAIGVFGAILALSVQSRLGDGVGGLPTFDLRTLWLCVCGAIGSLTGFHICRGRLGWSGINGAANAVVQGFWVTMVGSVIAGTLALPLFGTMFAPWLLLVTFFEAPFLLILWCIVLGASHVLVVRWQEERNSIFVPLRPQPVPARAS